MVQAPGAGLSMKPKSHPGRPFLLLSKRRLCLRQTPTTMQIQIKNPLPKILGWLILLAFTLVIILSQISD